MVPLAMKASGKEVWQGKLGEFLLKEQIEPDKIAFPTGGCYLPDQ